MKITKNNNPWRPNEFSPQDPKEWKIFPRNLTARAAYIVPGNPSNTRPEDAVDNCYPGLEMDARNLHKYFFPGLYFEVYRGDGARLVELTPSDRAAQWINLGLKESDLQDELFLWILKGKTAADEDATNPPAIEFVDTSYTTNIQDLGGLYIWRKVNALFPGKTAVAIGPKPPATGDSLNAAKAQLDSSWNNNNSHVERDPNGKLKFAILITDRSVYLSNQGVIDPDVYKPGELTRTLCTPWTYDFRDCQCFYWASNKPDVNSSEDGKYQYLNFQRKNSNIEPQTEDIANSYEARRLREIDYAEMMVDWEQLRPVVNGREYGESYKPPIPPKGRILTLEEIKKELAYLATVEHALAVQYLYAYYSVNAPAEEPPEPDLKTFRIWKGANEVFNIAIDEMRHLHWVNQVLKLLGVETTVKRAAKIGRRFEVPFYLQSLTSTQLQWFIDVEEPSRSTSIGLDGMYVGIQTSLQQLSPEELDPETQRRAVEIIKLIIDEGEGHYVRFSTAQQNLAFYDNAGRGDLPKYIRGGHWSQLSDQPNPELPNSKLYGVPHVEKLGSEGLILQKQSDAVYLTLIVFLKLAFAMQDEKISGASLRQAISLMFKLNAINFQLAEKGLTPLFTIPKWWESDPPVTSQEIAKTLLNTAKKQLLESGVLQSPAIAQFAQKAPLTESKVLKEPILSKVLQKAHNESIDEVLAHFDNAISKTTFQ